MQKLSVAILWDPADKDPTNQIHPTMNVFVGHIIILLADSLKLALDSVMRILRQVEEVFLAALATVKIIGKLCHVFLHQKAAQHINFSRAVSEPGMPIVHLVYRRIRLKGSQHRNTPGSPSRGV